MLYWRHTILLVAMLFLLPDNQVNWLILGLFNDAFSTAYVGVDNL
jgi:hypothetical protein